MSYWFNLLLLYLYNLIQILQLTYENIRFKIALLFSCKISNTMFHISGCETAILPIQVILLLHSTVSLFPSLLYASNLSFQRHVKSAWLLYQKEPL